MKIALITYHSSKKKGPRLACPFFVMEQFRWAACPHPPHRRAQGVGVGRGVEKILKQIKSIRKETLYEQLNTYWKKKEEVSIHLLLIHGQNLHDEQLLAVVDHLDCCPCHCSECQEVVVMFFSLDVLSWKSHQAKESVYKEIEKKQTKLGVSLHKRLLVMGSWWETA